MYDDAPMAETQEVSRGPLQPYCDRPGKQLRVQGWEKREKQGSLQLHVPARSGSGDGGVRKVSQAVRLVRLVRLVGRRSATTEMFTTWMYS